MKRRTYRRSKRKFRTSRSAWKDIYRRFGRGRKASDYRGVRAQHTRTHWVWVVV